MTPYLKTNNGVKVYSDEGKVKMFVDIWKNVFRISDEENRQFDQTNEEIVTEYLANNMDRITPNEKSNLNNLIINDPLLKPIERKDIKLIIKKHER